MFQEKHDYANETKYINLRSVYGSLVSTLSVCQIYTTKVHRRGTLVGLSHLLKCYNTFISFLSLSLFKKSGMAFSCGGRWSHFSLNAANALMA